MKYIEIAVGKVSDRNIIIPESKLRSWVSQARKAKAELYRSMYYFDEEILEHMKIRKTIRGYKGKFYIDKLIFDIDKGTSTDEFTLQRAREFLSKLEDDWKCSRECIRFWFSGTGYHIICPEFFHFEPSQFLPEEVTNTFKEYFPECDTLPYSHTGLIRVGQTLNLKKGRYKTLLTTEEFLGLDAQQIISLAERGETRKLEDIEEDHELNWNDKIVKATVLREKASSIEDPTAIVTCMQHLWNRGEKEGSRHIDIMRLISAFRRKGLAKSATEVLVRTWAKSLEPYEVTRCVNNGYDVGYVFPCKDFVMASLCDTKCVYFKNKNYTLDLTSSVSSEEKLVLMVRSGYKNKRFNLRTVFPAIKTDFWTSPKEYVLIIGDTGIGKTALAQNIAVKLKNMKVLYINSELPDELLFRRDIQIEYGWSKEEVMKYYEKNSNGLSKNLQHITRYSSPIDLDGLRKLVVQEEPNILILDTIRNIKPGKLLDYKSRDEAVASGVKDIAQTFNTIVIAVHHIPKHAIVDSDNKPKRLGLHSGKGETDYEDLADKVITFEGSQNDPHRIMESKKARDESPFHVEFNYDWKTFEFLDYEISSTVITPDGDLTKQRK